MTAPPTGSNAGLREKHAMTFERSGLPPSSLPHEEEDEESLQDLLSQCATNLTQKAAAGELLAAYEREQEVEQILTSLASPLKGRILVTGGPRVGKTAIIHEVAARIQAGQCPDALRGAELWGLSARSILRAFGVQGWQEKLGRLLEQWTARPDVILYVDALPTTLAAGATAEDPFDMAQFLLGQLQSSTNRILAEGRTQAVNSFLEAYPEYKHVLMEVRIPEPTIEKAREMIRRAAHDLEASQGVTIERGAVEVALDLTRHFALSEHLPGKAIDLIAEGIALRSERGSRAALRVSAEDIITRFEEKTGLPRILLTDQEPYNEQAVRRYFSDRVLGQDQAVDVIVQTLSLLRTRLNNPNRPMGVFLFIGPTGVGKTELAHALAQFLFGSEKHLVRFNMADYTMDWHVQTLFGNPHGFDIESRRGQFTMRLQEHAFAVVLLDEFEKAHPEIFQRFLQLFDEGMLLNGASELVNLRNSIFILTSNFGARLLNVGRLGFGPTVSPEEQENRIREEMVQFFTPEFINRIDSVCLFKPLTKSVLREIAYRRVQEILQREGLIRRRLEIEVDEDVIEWVVEHGYSERYGARYLARQIEKTITYPLAQQLINNNPPPGSMLRLFMRNERVASALVLPTTTHVVAEKDLATGPAEIGHLPERLTASYIQAGLPALRRRVETLEASHRIAEARTRQADLLRAMSTPSFWDEPGAIQPRLDELGQLSSQVELVDGLRRNLDELEHFVREMEQGNRPDLLSEAALRYRYLVYELPRAELTLLFNDPRDTCGAYLHIAARGRRLVASRWATDLARMYLGWAARREFPAVIVAEELNQKGTTRGCWLGIGGYGAYGLLRGETGLHRLVQEAEGQEGRRQVVQATVTVWPDLPDSELDGEAQRQVRLRTQAISRSGVLSGRLITQVEASSGEDSLPTLRLMSALPADDLMTEARRLVELQAIFKDHRSPEGSDRQLVRSYVRFKKRYVEDHRTGLKTSRLKATLKGDLDPFLEAYLKQESETREAGQPDLEEALA